MEGGLGEKLGAYSYLPLIRVPAFVPGLTTPVTWVSLLFSRARAWALRDDGVVHMCERISPHIHILLHGWKGLTRSFFTLFVSSIVSFSFFRVTRAFFAGCMVRMEHCKVEKKPLQINR